MKNCSLAILLFLVISVMLIASPNRSLAAPVAPRAIVSSAWELSALEKVRYGCGWDYPCSPRRDFGRRSYSRPGQVYIHNNYGTVNVYENPRREHVRPREEVRPCCAGAEPARPIYHDRVEDENCRGTPCEKCGAWCWYRRFKEGYCGHGCEVYREKVRFERERRIVDYPRPFYYRDPPPRYEPYEREYTPSYERHRDEEPYPRRRFDGPQYPSNCSNGGC